jgi:hypothetical protein
MSFRWRWSKWSIRPQHLLEIAEAAPIPFSSSAANDQKNARPSVPVKVARGDNRAGCARGGTDGKRKLELNVWFRDGVRAADPAKVPV